MSRLELPVSEDIRSRYLTVNGLRLHILEHGQDDAPHKIMMVHGNVAAATWWEECMLALDAATYHSVAVDLRGYGMSEAAPVDATRGLGDFADDLAALLDALGWETYHVWGHSMGTGVLYQHLLAHSAAVRSVVLVAPMSPYGFGGTKDIQGTPCYEDYAGSGAGLWAARGDLLDMMRDNHREDDHPAAPLSLIRQTIVKPPFIHPRESAILDAFNATATGENNVPGDWQQSQNWPFVAPGERGVLNAFSPKYFDASGLADIDPKPPILWVRGTDDVIISNTSLSDAATHGIVGAIPGYPGTDVFPQQPMIDQIRAVLDAYGPYEEVVFEDCGHSPQAEKFDQFMPLAIQLMDSNEAH